jgi:hypothetical protein
MNYEITELKSNDGENIEIKPIVVEAKVESWMKKLVEHMKIALRKLFYKHL